MPLMAGKQGLIMGVANERSIAWGIAKALHEQGARLAFTYQGEALGKRVRPLADSVNGDFMIEADVSSEESLDSVFAVVSRRWGRLDFVVHAIAVGADRRKGHRMRVGLAPPRLVEPTAEWGERFGLRDIVHNGPLSTGHNPTLSVTSRQTTGVA